ncbi:glycosyl transferase [Brevundimonas intermedia]|uniref:Glycosyl transferase n=1 Tax=Brevundimonas intermedia TaxID=74315 RepID=A0ABQ5T5Z1_9CAUL|nr:glycosyltransferase [Brevundimonas intermedia]GLK47808.1 glycosyl transferase [Brevundimonas intermedia]
MRVLLVNSLYPPQDVGGAERSVEQLARGLVAAGVTVSAATLVETGGGVEMRDGVRVHRLPLRHVYWPYGGRRRTGVMRALWHGLEAASPLMDPAVSRVAQMEQPDLIHAHVLTGFAGAVHRAARRAGLPLVQSLRDYSTLCSRAALFRRGRVCEQRCGDCVLLSEPRRRATAGVDHVVGISGAVLERHRAAGCFGDTPATVIGNAAGQGRGIDQPRDGPPAFGFLGRIEPEKGIEVLLKATTRLGGDWRLRVAGRGEADYVARLRRGFPDPRIDWLGQVEAEVFYGGVDVVVAPAIWAEPFGRVAVEALMRGRGVIASRIGGLPEAAAGGGRVKLVAPGEAGALAGALQAVTEAPGLWRNPGPAFNPIWTEASVVQAHLAVYREVLARRSSASRASSRRADPAQV